MRTPRKVMLGYILYSENVGHNKTEFLGILQSSYSVLFGIIDYLETLQVHGEERVAIWQKVMLGDCDRFC